MFFCSMFSVLLKCWFSILVLWLDVEGLFFMFCIMVVLVWWCFYYLMFSMMVKISVMLRMIYSCVFLLLSGWWFLNEIIGLSHQISVVSVRKL